MSLKKTWASSKYCRMYPNSCLESPLYSLTLRPDLLEPVTASVVKDRVMFTRVWDCSLTIRHSDCHMITTWAGQQDPGLRGVVGKFPKNP